MRRQIVKYALMVFIIGFISVFFVLLGNYYKENEFVEEYIPTSYLDELRVFASKNALKDGYYDVKSLENEFEFKEPIEGYIKIEKSQVISYEFYYDNYYELCVKEKCEKETYDISSFKSVKEFGAVGDGVSDDTSAIKAAVKYINENGGILYFPTATYLVSAQANKDNIMEITSEKEIVIDFMGSTIKLSNNGFPRYSVVKALYTKYLIVKNGVLVGDRLTHDYTVGELAESSSHAFGSGIYFDNSRYALAYNMESYNFTGDSMVMKNSKSGGVMIADECNFHHSRRQGITVVESDQVIIKNTIIHHIGSMDDVKGVSPMAGIDVEPEWDTYKVNKIVFDNVNIYDIDGYGLVANKTWRNENVMPSPDITITNSTIEKPAVDNAVIKDSVLNFTKPISILLQDDDIENTTFNINTFDGVDHASSLFMKEGRVNNSVFKSVADPQNINGKIYFYDTVVTNSKFIDIKGSDKVSTRSNADFGIVLFGDQGGFGDGSQNNEFHNCNIYAQGDVDIDYSKLYNCTLYTSESVKFLQVEIYGGTTMSSSEATIEMINCKMVNAGHFENSIKILENCNIEVDIMPNAFGVGSILKNTNISITDRAMINSFLLVSSIENSIITVEKYSNERKFDNQYIDNFNDYVFYLGDIKLTYSLK